MTSLSFSAGASASAASSQQSMIDYLVDLSVINSAASKLGRFDQQRKQIISAKSGES